MHAVGIAAGMKFVLYPSSNHFILKSSIIRLSLLPFPSRFLSLLIHSPASLLFCSSLSTLTHTLQPSFSIHTPSLLNPLFPIHLPPLSPFTHPSLSKPYSPSLPYHLPHLSPLTHSAASLSPLTHISLTFSNSPAFLSPQPPPSLPLTHHLTSLFPLTLFLLLTHPPLCPTLSPPPTNLLTPSLSLSHLTHSCTPPNLPLFKR